MAWGPVVLGAMSGLGAALIVFIALGITGVIDGDSAAIPAAFLQFLGQLGAGYVAARIGRRDHVVHGSYASLLLYLVAAAITLAAAPDTIGPVTLIVFALVAAILGSAGGLLAAAAGDGSP